MAANLPLFTHQRLTGTRSKLLDVLFEAFIFAASKSVKTNKPGEIP